MLNYKVVGRVKANTQESMFYAQVSAVTPMTLDQVSDLISSRTTVSPSDVKAVLDAVQYEVRNALLDGKSVRLGDLGSFRPTIASKAALSAEAFLSSNIKGVRVRYTPSASLVRGLKLDRATLRNVTAASSATGGGGNEGGDSGDGGSDL